MAEELLERETIVLTDIERIMTDLHPEKYPRKEQPAAPAPPTPVAEKPEEQADEIAPEPPAPEIAGEEQVKDAESVPSTPEGVKEV